jgi:glycosyltransferase involved in cell wall biosynthesis
MNPLISLILPTINRFNEVVRYIESLYIQNYKNWELIVIDQNLNSSLSDYLSNLNDIRIKLVKSDKGVARARNTGLKLANGSYISFPDDDCWYSESTTLSQVINLMANHNIDLLSCYSLDPHDNIINHKKKSYNINKFNVWRTTVSYTLFFKTELLLKCNGFDERLGVGANTLWGSGEETDLVLRFLRLNAKSIYKTDIYIYHPNKDKVKNDQYLLRSCLYSMGAGAVIRKNHLPIFTLIYFSIRSFIGILLSIIKLDRFNYSRYVIIFSGRILGWLTWQK